MTRQNLTYQKALKAIEKEGALLVFPIKNKAAPLSLWSSLYPRSKMDWNWDTDADDRVVQLWSLMKKLSVDSQVVYSKWYQGRASFFSPTVFIALLCRLQHKNIPLRQNFSQEILEILENDSPLSTKQLKKMTELQGRDNQKYYDRALRELFQQFLIVGHGEVEDGAFPSLAVGATRTLRESLWKEAKKMSPSQAQGILEEKLGTANLFYHFLEKIERTATASI